MLADTRKFTFDVAVSFHLSGQPSVYSSSYASMSGPTEVFVLLDTCIFGPVGLGVWGRHQAICICAVIVVELLLFVTCEPLPNRSHTICTKGET